MLSDIREQSGLGESEFWDSFYELLMDGELEDTENGQYFVREDVKKQWIKEIDKEFNPSFNY